MNCFNRQNVGILELLSLSPNTEGEALLKIFTFTAFDSSTFQSSTHTNNAAFPSKIPCEAQWNSYWKSSSSFSQIEASIIKMTTGDIPDFEALAPECRNVNGPMLNSRCGPCTIVGGDVLLYYWPVDTALSSSNITKGPKSGGLVTIVAEKNTFTSPTVYLSFYEPYATDSCGIWHASSRNAILSMSSDAVRSLAGYDSHGEVILKTINYADLNISANVTSEIIPCRDLSSSQMRTCSHEGPQNLPFLEVPDEIRYLDRSWNNCVVPGPYLAAFDPPRVLLPAQALMASTTAAEIVRTSATAMPAPSIWPQGALASTTEFAAAPSSSTVPMKPTNHGPSKNKEAIHSSTEGITPQDIAIEDIAIKDLSSLFPLAQDLPAKLPPSSKYSLPEDSAVKDPWADEPSVHRYLSWLSVPVSDSPAHGKSQQASIFLSDILLPKNTEAPAHDPSIEVPSAKDSLAKNLPSKEPSTKDYSAEDHTAPHDLVYKNNQQVGKSLADSLLPTTIELPAHEPSAKDPSIRNPLAKDPLTKDPPVFFAFSILHDHQLSDSGSHAHGTNQPVGVESPTGDLLPTKTVKSVYDRPVYPAYRQKNKQDSEYLASNFFWSKGATARGEAPVQNRFTKDLSSSTKIVPLHQYLLSTANPPLVSDFLTTTSSVAVGIFSQSQKKGTTERGLDVITLSASQARFTIIEYKTSGSQASVISNNGAVVFSDGSAATKTSHRVSVGLCALGAIFFFALTFS